MKIRLINPYGNKEAYFSKEKKMKVHLTPVCLGAVIMCLWVSCQSSAVSGPESKAGWGIPSFPSPQSFTEEITNLPNPFVSWQGNSVSAETWHLRREEIAQIMQHYMLGYKLPEAGVSTIVRSVAPPDANGRQLVTFSVTRGGKSADFYATMTLPSGPPPIGGYPVILINDSSADTAISRDRLPYAVVTERGYAKLQIHLASIASGDKGPDIDNTYFDEANIGGLVKELYPEIRYFTGNPISGGWDEEEQRWITDKGWISDYGDPDAPGLMMLWAWGVSRLIDALELEYAKPADQRKFYLNPQKIAITGSSRNGKSALITGAYDTRIAVVNPTTNGGGGLPIDRFVSVSVNEADSTRNGPYGPYPKPAHDAPYGPFGGYGAINKEYQYLKKGDEQYGTLAARVVTAKEALIDPTRNLDGGVTISWPEANNDQGHIIWKDQDPGATNLKDGYGVHKHWFTYPDHFRPWGPQGLPDIRWRYPNYWSSRFHQLPLIYNHLNLHTRESSGDWGYFVNAPFDQHYLSALVAPRPLLIAEGFVSENTAPEGHFMNFLATREVYRLLNAEDNIGIGMYVHGHAQVEREVVDLLDLCDSFYTGGLMPARLRPKTVDEYPFPINDPRSRFDYLKLDWAAPGYISVAGQVKELVPSNYSY
ncbi:MAG: hypothetical protein LBK43_00255 [Treponema sp.]|nr:hypothetical protein [Treponema sp.]